MSLFRKALCIVGSVIAVCAVLAAGCGTQERPELTESLCTETEFVGEGAPQLFIASDLPLRWPARPQTEQIVAAIRFELDGRGWKAGAHTVGFRSCDNTTDNTGASDAGRCAENASTYADAADLVGVIGTFSWACSAIMLPVLNRARGGAVAMVSPADTWPCLTRGVPGGCDGSEPDRFYPTGVRNYTRVIPSDVSQGAFDAEFAAKLGVQRIYVLTDEEPYGRAVATVFRRAAEHLGIDIAGVESWDPGASSYSVLFKRVEQSGADAVFLGGTIDEHSAQLLEDKVAVLGPNEGRVKLIAPDGFASPATLDEAGSAAAGMFISSPGVPTESLPAAARELADALQAGPLAGTKLDPIALYGVLAARVLLDAIAASDGTRADVIANLFDTHMNGPLGTISFDRNGDLTVVAGPMSKWTMFVVRGGLEPDDSFTPDDATVAAAGVR